MIFLKSKKRKYSDILEEWLKDKENEVKEQSYVKYYNVIQSYIIPCLGDVVYSKLNEKNIINFFNLEKINSLADSTKKIILYVIKNSISYGVERRLRKPLKKLDIKIKTPKGKITYFTKLEQEKIESYLKSKLDIRKLGILICLYTGIRLGEICALQWKDIDFVNKCLSIKKTVQRIKNLDPNSKTKTKIIVTKPKSDTSIRTIPIPDFIIELLLKFKSEPDNFILTNSLNPKDNRVYEKYFENILKRCNIKNLNFHSLRHTFATRSIEAKMDIKTLSEILGHSTYHITLETYVHSSFDLKRDSLNVLVNYLTPKTS